MTVPARKGSSCSGCDELSDPGNSIQTGSSWVENMSPDQHLPTFIVKKCLGMGTEVREHTSRLQDLCSTASDPCASSIRQHLLSESSLAEEAERGFRNGYLPELVEDCCGGTYFMKDVVGETLAVFKPADEEPYAPENPKGYVGGAMYGTSPMKEGVEVGLAAERECAAYLLDHLHRARVPETSMLRIRHPSRPDLKFGSLQKFVRNECSSEDMGPSKFTLSDVHSIAILDVRLCNSDRHPGNILVTRGFDGGFELVPIDHGYVLPKWRYLHELDFCWVYWPQAKQPFTEAELMYIDSLDAEDDASFIRHALSLAEDCLRSLRIGTLLLKLGAKAGLTLHDIGKMMIRAHPDERSRLEVEVWKAEEAALKEVRRFPAHLMKVIAANGTKDDGRAALEAAFGRHLERNLNVAIQDVQESKNPPRADLSDALESLEL
eukprot:CAMPEP_0117026216 /NCGR_PEP_ID=MMETSP0472-20121206/19299_1 /TAXON_ID=693140 ORGANISM="Tiarina fusus, Strain LIS" /NCGR_SAMPLE_ID=MMETSP0472 /ASSEMBLY_ACC=CAM_ASM_000603 /LENGTH=434 /DNA_ID=CAMNT_0004733169 /DNA_START=113 /DNA_END=1417 /DNA_ORIENTATION=-